MPTVPGRPSAPSPEERPPSAGASSLQLPLRGDAGVKRRASNPAPTRAPAASGSRRLWIGAAVIAVLGFGLYFGLRGSQSSEPHGNRAGGRAPRGNLCQQLKCTPEQREEVVAVVRRYRRESKDERAAVEQQWRAIADLYAGEAIDDDAVEEAYAELARRQQAADGRASVALAELHALLTAEQRRALAGTVARLGPDAALNRRSSPRRGKKKKGRKGRKGRKGANDRRGNQPTMMARPPADPGARRPRIPAATRDQADEELDDDAMDEEPFENDEPAAPPPMRKQPV